MPRLTPVQIKLYDAALHIFAERGTTQTNVSELAQVAGMARGTVYNNLKNPDSLFEEVAANLAEEMHQRILAGFAGVEDPALRLSIGIRLFVRRAHDEPRWGRFIVRFAYSNMSLQGMWAGPPAVDLQFGINSGRYSVDSGKFVSLLAAIAGSCLSAMFLVLEGHKTWRDAGSEAAEFALRGLGLSFEQALSLSRAELPDR